MLEDQTLFVGDRVVDIGHPAAPLLRQPYGTPPADRYGPVNFEVPPASENWDDDEPVVSPLVAQRAAILDIPVYRVQDVMGRSRTFKKGFIADERRRLLRVDEERRRLLRDEERRRAMMDDQQYGRRG